jgi:quercetin 2,3-dioxygenase
MDRKDFLKKGLLGTGMFITSTAFGNVIKNNIDELYDLDIIGFNHLPISTSKIMENTILHKSETRGDANHGWLHSKHTFSFANYYNPERMHFGVLRVLNDDHVAAGMGFGTHPHDNMEIISIPLEGDLEHKDSMGNTTIIKNGDIQVMSAGTGIQHSEYNKNVTPRYDQITLKLEDRHNKLQQILSPNASDEGVWIHQNAWFHLGKFDKGITKDYTIKGKGNGVYIFNLIGTLDVNGQLIETRDGYGIWDTEKITITANVDSEFLLMEVPMSL